MRRDNPFDPIYTVKTGTLENSTGGRRVLARKSNGDLWCTYHRSDGTTQQIYCAYSTDNGQTWTEEQITNQTGTNHQWDPVIAIDSADNVHVIWFGLGWETNTTNYNIQYRKRTTSWQAQEAITNVAYDQYRPSVAIDSADNVHVIWHGEGWGGNTANRNIQYRMRNATSWQTQEGVTDVAYNQYNAPIAVDSADNIQIVWEGLGWGTNPDNRNIQYRERTALGWQTQEAITNENNDQVWPSIAIDSSDNIHVVWDGLGWGTNPTNYNLQYRERTNSGWQTQEPVTDVADWQAYSSIAIDSNNNVHAVWEGWGWGTNPTNYNIRYRKRTTSWQTQVGITDRAYWNEHPRLIWALHPIVSTAKTNRPKTGYALVWSGQDADGYKVEYCASDDLSWEEAAAAAGNSMAAKMMVAGVL